MYCKVLKVWPLATRSYTDRQGAAQTWDSKGFLLFDGKHSFYAEASQETARAIDALNVQPNVAVLCDVRFVARSYKTQQGDERYNNDCMLLNMTTA